MIDKILPLLRASKERDVSKVCLPEPPIHTRTEDFRTMQENLWSLSFMLSWDYSYFSQLKFADGNRLERTWELSQERWNRTIALYPKDVRITSESRAWAFSSDSKRSPAVAFNTTGVFFQRWGGTASMAMSSNLLTDSAPLKKEIVFLTVFFLQKMSLPTPQN